MHTGVEPPVNRKPRIARASEMSSSPPWLHSPCRNLTLFPDAWLMVKVTEFDVPPPGAPVNTVTAAVPDVATSPTGIVVVSLVALTNWVVRSAPFQRMVEAPFTKFVPLTVNRNAADPASLLVGSRVVIVGTGFGWVD